MELKEFDNALMVLAHEIRKCRETTKKVTGSYPDHVRQQSETLEKTMAHADLIIGQLSSMLSEQQRSLLKTCQSVNETGG